MPAPANRAGCRNSCTSPGLVKVNWKLYPGPNNPESTDLSSQVTVCATVSVLVHVTVVWSTVDPAGRTRSSAHSRSRSTKPPQAPVQAPEREQESQPGRRGRRRRRRRRRRLRPWRSSAGPRHRPDLAASGLARRAVVEHVHRLAIAREADVNRVLEPIQAVGRCPALDAVANENAVGRRRPATHSPSG